MRIINLPITIFLVTAKCIFSWKLKFEPSASPNPVVLWHGMGDDCCHSFSMGAIKKMIEKAVPNIYVHSLCLGSQIGDASCNEGVDTETGFLGDSQQTIDYACWRLTQDLNFMQAIKNSPDQKINIIGFSQGGLFSRVLAQQCENFEFKNVISIGGPQNGINGVPHCPQNTPSWLCDTMSELLNFGAYWSWIQNKSIQAQYWHDPLDQNAYIQGSKFLAKVNLEKNSLTPEELADKKYLGAPEKLNRLENLALVKFSKDEMVVPRVSEWFGYYTPGQNKNLSAMQDLEIYDNLGLRKLDDAGKIHFLSVDEQHLQFSDEWFHQVVIDGFLRP